MNLVDYDTQRHALVRRLIGAASPEALAHLVAEIALRPALAGGESVTVMQRRGAAVVDRLAALDGGIEERRQKYPRQPRRSRAWRAADAVFGPESTTQETGR